jgi:c(7)-type cytochrome triheme protein
MRATFSTARWTGFLAGAALASAALGANLHKLPAEFAFPPGDGSPGTVTFRHESHVDLARPGSACVACHPARFAILEKGRAAGLPAIKHEAMEKGQACGACHGKQAFGFEACDLCHKG